MLSRLLISVCIGTTAAVSLVFRLENLTVSTHSMAANGVTVATAVFNQSATRVEQVSLTSSNPGVASVPASVPVIPPNDRVTFPVRGVSAGCTTIIAAYKGRSREQEIVVYATNSGEKFSLAVPDLAVRLGGQSPARVITGTKGTAPVMLSSSNAKVAWVPSRVEAAQGIASFSITGAREGCAIISATIRGQTVSRTVRVAEGGG